jgi:protein gp37
MNLDHARELRDACQQEGIPYFFKQHSWRFPKHHPDGKRLDGVEWCERPIPAAPTEALALF